MTLSIDDRHIRLQGVVRVEEAEALLAALQDGADREVDLSGCEGLHAAVLQVLMVLRPPLGGWVGNPTLEAWLRPLLAPKPPMEPKS
jgi:hypothetical protein